MKITNVWANNLDEELIKISQLIEKYNYIAIDTEFSGFIQKTTLSTLGEQLYKALRFNVNSLKLIQIGITLCDFNGKLSEPYCTWQFNLQFSLSSDLHSSDSIDILKSAGIEFDKFEKEGIDPLDFFSRLYSTQLLMNDKITWIVFHGSYDFSYLIKYITNKPLPEKENEFINLLKIYFPKFFDLRRIIIEKNNIIARIYLEKFSHIDQQLILRSDNTIGGLQDISNSLGINRDGPQHQAGSDSYVTLLSFYKIKNFFLFFLIILIILKIIFNFFFFFFFF